MTGAGLLEARIQYIANYYGLTYESDTAATQQTQNRTLMPMNANANTNVNAGVVEPRDSSTTTATVCSGCRCKVEEPVSWS